jgi:hypothetical protein
MKRHALFTSMCPRGHANLTHIVTENDATPRPAMLKCAHRECSHEPKYPVMVPGDVCGQTVLTS